MYFKISKSLKERMAETIETSQTQITADFMRAVVTILSYLKANFIATYRSTLIKARWSSDAEKGMEKNLKATVK